MKFCRNLNNLFLILVINCLYICGQTSNSSSLFGFEAISSDLSTLSKQIFNSTQGLNQIDRHNKTIFSNAFTENSSESYTTKNIDSTEVDFAEDSDILTTDSNIFRDITTINELKDLSNHINNSGITQIINNWDEKKEIETTNTGFTQLYNISSKLEPTSTHSSIDSTNFPRLTSESLVLAQNSNNPNSSESFDMLYVWNQLKHRKDVQNTTSINNDILKTTTDISTNIEPKISGPPINISEDKEFSKRSKEREAVNSFKTMCTFGEWSANRRGFGRFDLTHLERAPLVVSNCSHIIYSFVTLDPNSKVISADPQSGDQLLPERFARLNALKKYNPKLKIMISLGGWATPAHVWTYLLLNHTKRQKTIGNINQFLKLYSFDGLVISWFYPGAKWRGGHISDKDNFVIFLKELKLTLNKSIELGVMGPTDNRDIDNGFDVPNISSSVDYILLMTYDYFGSWDSTVNHLAPLYPNSKTSNKLNVNFTLHYWLNKGVDPNKLILGLATYGRSFTLADPQNNNINAHAIGPGIPGPYTNQPGILGFNEICEIFLSTSGVKLEEDSHGITPFIHLYDQWIGFEDELSIFRKTMYALKHRLKGIFFWTLDLDDFQNKCEWGHFPLLRAAVRAISQNKFV